MENELTFKNQAKVVDYSSCDCESFYECPFCKNVVGFFSVYNDTKTKSVRHLNNVARVYKCRKCGKTIWFE